LLVIACLFAIAAAARRAYRSEGDVVAAANIPNINGVEVKRNVLPAGCQLSPHGGCIGRRRGDDADAYFRNACDGGDESIVRPLLFSEGVASGDVRGDGHVSVPLVDVNVLISSSSLDDVGEEA
jgi:hypothetical protein